MIAVLSPRRTLPILILVPFILIAITLFYQRRTQPVVNTLISYPLTEPTIIRPIELIPRIHQPLSLTILRGILVYYPELKEAFFLPELRWLYRSWIEMMKDEPPTWRTDLIIYTGNFTSSLQQLGCIYNQIRMDEAGPPQCRVFPYQSVSFRPVNSTAPDADTHAYQQFDRARSTLLTEQLRGYSYIDSINIIAECYPSFAMYDYILRTDMDVFLTKNFGHFVPYNDTLLVGQGGYSTRFTTNRLERIARNKGWSYANITNIGSTWYGPPQVAQRIANFSLEAILYLHQNEFTTPEKKGRLGAMLWPEWHYGVLLLYGCDMAINHLALSENIKIGLAYNFLDQFTTRTDPYDIEKNNRLHLHCWHTEGPFSKFLFKDGKYNHIHPSTLVNDTSASGYSLRMALESQLMSSEELKQALLKAKNVSKL